MVGNSILDFLNTQQPDMQPMDSMNQMQAPMQQPPQSMVQQILTNRFQNLAEPTAQDVGNAAMAGISNNSYVDPGQAGDQRIANAMKQMLMISQAQKDMSMANIYNQGGPGNATIKAANAIMQENPGMSFSDAFSFAKSGLGQGVTYQNGTVTTMPGAPQAAGAMAAGKETGQRGVELQFAAPIANAGKTGAMQGDIVTQAQADLPKAIDNAQTSIDVIKETLNHPGLPNNFGMTGMIPNRPGSPASDAKALLDQIKGGGFLTAYGQLRGGGQISNVEGEKATAAYARMQTTQSLEGFKKAANEYVGIIEKGVQRARNTASGQVFNGGAPVALTGGSEGGNDAPGTLIGTSNGKKVYQLPDGSHVMEQ